MTYNDIAAYTDDQVPKYINILLNDSKFLNILKKLQNKFWKESFKSLVDHVKNIKTIRDIQQLTYKLLKYNIKTSTDGLTYNGMENLPNSRIIFISNHRSTSLDAGYLNYILLSENKETSFNGAGDNIFEAEWLGHAIRLNKGFIIKRNVEDFDEKIYEANRLSKYINELLLEGHSIWIANKPGRAKDGLDKTDSVVISMLYKSAGKKNYGEWLKWVNLIPLSISWEIIPGDLLLAKDVAGEYNNNKPFKDLKNILYEIKAYKGRVHYSFCNRVFGEKRTEIVNAVDKEIHINYKLWGSNWLAYLKLNDVNDADKSLILKHIDIEKAENILNRADVLSVQAKQNFYEIYANPVRSALIHIKSIRNYFNMTDCIEIK